MEIRVETMPVVPVKPVKLFHLTLTEEEVEILFLLSTSINGFNNTGLRQNTDKWYHSLHESLKITDNNTEAIRFVSKLRKKYKLNPKMDHINLLDNE